jgi:hypothetical protein
MEATRSRNYEFDVAISFVRGDLDLALDFAERLSPELRVFVHSRDRETLTAADGAEAARTVFRERARLTLLLHRSGWGATAWTAAEEAAIRERCNATNYRSLVLVNLEGSAPPDWLPEGYLQFDLQAYPIEQLIGVIKARAQELGAQLQQASLTDRAAALEQRRAFDSETARLLEGGTAAWVAAREALVGAIQEQAGETAARTGWEIEYGPGATIGGFVVVLQGQSIQLADCELERDSARRAYLELREYDTRLAVERPGQSSTARPAPEVARVTRIELRRRPALGWCWQIDGKVRPTAEAAEAVLEKLRERVERELRPKSWEP